MFNEKGQESAPFELLIAIIIMTFVIVVGFQALDKLSTETCKGFLDQDLEELKRGIETVVKTKTKIDVSFELPNCFTEAKSDLRIVQRRESRFCSNICGGSVAQCTALRFISPGHSSFKCLKISAATDFNPSGVCGDANPDAIRFESVNWEPTGGAIIDADKDGIPDEDVIESGRYTLIRQSNLFTSVPQICIYKRI